MSLPPRLTLAEQQATLCASFHQVHPGGLCKEMTCNQDSRRQLNDCHRTVLCAQTSALSDLPRGHLRATSSLSCNQHPPTPSAKPSQGTLTGCHPPPTRRVRPQRGKAARTGQMGIGEAPCTAGTGHCPAAPARNTIPLRQPQRHRPPRGNRNEEAKAFTLRTAKLR